MSIPLGYHLRNITKQLLIIYDLHSLMMIDICDHVTYLIITLGNPKC